MQSDCSKDPSDLIDQSLCTHTYYSRFATDTVPFSVGITEIRESVMCEATGTEGGRVRDR